MIAWDGLVSVALVGTGRSPIPPAVAVGVRSALGAEAPATTPEISVLNAAGVLAAYRRAGWSPPLSQAPAPDPCPPDDRPLASPAVTQLLELLLDGQVAVPGGPAPLVADWLDRCARRGRRPPDRLLPRLADSATADQALRAGAVAAGGPLLRWLGIRNPEWSWAAPQAVLGVDPQLEAERLWSTGDRDARMALLSSLRQDRPDQARALVGSTWSSENARDRAGIVAAFAVGLGPADEAFLEAALDDRAKGVRSAAAGLLHRLPESRLAQRMAGRLQPLVTASGRLRRKIEVALPDEPDAAARRDGIVDDGAPSRTGPRAWWLIQIIAATPLSFWNEHLGLDPATVVRLADAREVRHGLVLAAQRQGSPEWASALLRSHPVPALISVLPPAEAQAAVEVLLPKAADNSLAALVEVTPGPWSLSTSRAFVGRLRAARTTGPLRSAIAALVIRLDPAVTPDLERWVVDLKDDDHARRIVGGLAQAISIRQTIARELA